MIKSKVPESVKSHGENYCLVGPLNAKEAAAEVEVIEPTFLPMATTLGKMRSAGVKVVYGRWLIEGAPRVLLFDIATSFPRAEEWKRDLFEQVHIGCPWEDNESNNAIVFGYLVAWFLGEYAHQMGQQPIIAHFHEWQSGIGLILCRVRRLTVATVFTTHATLLGRYLCADTSTDFYNHLARFDVDKEAGSRGIYHRYCIERASVHSAHVFTTVSHITADEAQYLLHRKADVILPNGLNVVKFSALHEFQNLHAKAKEKITSFVRGHFLGHLDFDLDKTLYFFTAGRYEYRNKGADMFIEALSRLNHLMRQSGTDVTVIAFIIMPAQVANYGIEALRGQAVVKTSRETVDQIKEKIAQKIFDGLVTGKLPNPDTLLDKDDQVRLKRALYSTQQRPLPPVTTHNVIDDHKDPILTQFRRLQLFNNHHDRVKVVFHPEFLSSTSPLLPLDYEEFVRGCHLGVFPSYYEPWGYTPAECTVMGVPSVTSNLSGFGLFMEKLIDDPASYGIYVIDRRFKSPDESIQQLTAHMFDFTQLTRRQRINLRNRTERLSDLLGWANLGVEYERARSLAVSRAYPEIAKAAKEDFLRRASAVNSPRFPSLKSDLAEDQPPDEQFEV